MVRAERKGVGGTDMGELFVEQAAFVFDEAAVTAAVTGRGGGKTRAGAIKLLLYLVKYPGALAMVTAPNYPELNDATFRAILGLWPRELIRHVTMAPGAGRIELTNGSEVLMRSTDQPDSLRGFDLCCAWMDEAAMSSEAAFDTLLPAVRKPGYPHQVWLTTTPKGYNWVYDAFVDPGQEGYTLHHWTSRENRHLLQEDIDRQEAKLGRELAMQEIGGEFVMVSGNVQFDEEWLHRLLSEAKAPETEYPDGPGTRVRLWAPYNPGHEYLLGIDTKGQGRDLAYGMLLDWTAGELMGEIRSTSKDATVMRASCIAVARRYNAMCVPETNGVGSEWPRAMMAAGCRMFVRPRRSGEAAEAHRSWAREHPGWHTSDDADLLEPLQSGFRLHRLSTKNKEFVQKTLSWDEAVDKHLPDIIAAAGLASAGGRALWGEMGSTVAEAGRRADGPRYGWGPSAARPFLSA